jgi:hypothetical protein
MKTPVFTRVCAFLGIGAAVIFGSNEVRAEETIAGGMLQVLVMDMEGSVQRWSPYIHERGYGTMNDGSGFWFDVGSARKLTGVCFKTRNESNLASRWDHFRLWGTNNREDAANKKWQNMTLVVSNYLGTATIGAYNTLTNYEGIAAYRYYYLTDYQNYSSFSGFEMWSADPSVRVLAPTVDNLDEGNYTYTGKVVYVEGDAGEVCVAVADRDYDDDFAKWQANGQVVKAGKTFAAGDAFSISVKGIGRGRRYSRVFVRANSEGTWYAGCKTWFFSARAEMMTLEAYVVDTKDPMATNSNGVVYNSNSAYCFYDGKTGAYVESGTGVSAIIFKLDPTKDYSSIRLYPRDTGPNVGLVCFSRCIDLYPFSVTADDLEFTGAIQSTAVEAPRTLYFVKPTGVPEANWTAIDSLKTTLRNFSDSSGKYIELPIPKGAFTGKKWLKIEVKDGSHSNCREIELLTVEASSFVIRVQ